MADIEFRQPEIQYQPVFYFSFSLKHCVNRLIGGLFDYIAAQFFKENLRGFFNRKFCTFGKNIIDCQRVLILLYTF